MLLREEMKEDIKYFEDEVNAPIAWLVHLYAKRYPQPTHENCVHPNSHILLDLEVEFFKDWDFKGRTQLLEDLWKIVIVKYEHSPNWRYCLDWFIMMVQKSGWKPWNPVRQMECWRK